MTGASFIASGRVPRMNIKERSGTNVSPATDCLDPFTLVLIWDPSTRYRYVR